MLFELRNSTSQCDLRYGSSMVGCLTSTLGRRLATRPNTDLPEPLIPISSRSKTLLFWRPSNDGVRAGEDPRERQGLTHPWSGPRDGPRTHRASPISRPRRWQLSHRPLQWRGLRKVLGLRAEVTGAARYDHGRCVAPPTAARLPPCRSRCDVSEHATVASWVGYWLGRRHSRKIRPLMKS